MDILQKTEFERELQKKGLKYICGVDEVGRGPLAGPVVCAAAIMDLSALIEGVDDSKKVPEKRRKILAEKIAENAIALNICRVEPQIIDQINILEATKLCMKNAIEGLKVKPDFVVVDGNMKLDIQIPQMSVIKGDARVYSVGAASIAAKVFRDKIMEEYAKTYKGYFFERNKGYGTRAHIEAIKVLGPSPIHRRSFIYNIWKEP